MNQAIDHRRPEPLRLSDDICSAARPPLNILLAEDNPVNQKLAVGLLEKRGHTVVAVGDGKAAVRACRQRHFDAILMDVQMPEMDGLEATARIRREESTTGRHTPIIALTSLATEADRTMCLDAGMDEHVAKPICTQALIGAIDRLVDNRQEGNVAPPDETALAAEPASAALAFDKAAALAHLDGDEGLLQEVAGLFLESSPPLLAEIRETFGRGDLQQLARAAHALKGAVANFHAQAAFELALALETAARKGDRKGAEGIWSTLEPELSRLTISLMHLMPGGTSCGS
jgi:two-component system, sensor histidine kinase and response regulator